MLARAVRLHECALVWLRLHSFCGGHIALSPAA